MCVCVCVHFEQWIVSFILNSGLYHLFWTVDCIIYFEQWIVSFILNSGLYHLFWTVGCIIYIEQWIVSFILNSGLYHLYWTVDCIIYFAQWIVSFIQASWKYINYPICYQHHGKQCRPRSNTADSGTCSGSIVFIQGFISKYLKKQKMHKWHPLNENGLAQIERIEESTKHKRVNIWTAACQNQQNDVCPAKTQISLGIRPVWSVFFVRMKKAWVLSYPSSAQRRLIRLSRCPGWSESSLGAQSFCWFCHEVAYFKIIK